MIVSRYLTCSVFVARKVVQIIGRCSHVLLAIEQGEIGAMKRRYQTWVTTVTSLAMLVSTITQASDIQHLVGPAQTRDVRLGAQGTLTGQLVDSQGMPLANQEVSLWQAGSLVAREATNQQGGFHFGKVVAGSYQLVAHETGANYRLWTNASAPPAAVDEVLLVRGEVVRGQYVQNGHYRGHPITDVRQPGLGGGHFGGAIMHTLSNPWVVGGAIAAGIAIPISQSNERRGDGS